MGIAPAENGDEDDELLRQRRAKREFQDKNRGSKVLVVRIHCISSNVLATPGFCISIYNYGYVLL
jgi:hypothetical protein